MVCVWGRLSRLMRGAPRRKQTLNCQTEQLRRLAVTITDRSQVIDIVKMTLLRVEYLRGPFRVSKVSERVRGHGWGAGRIQFGPGYYLDPW
jgi:hypothetical protein